MWEENLSPVRQRLATTEDLLRGLKALEVELGRRKEAGEPPLAMTEALTLYNAVVHHQEPPDTPFIVMAKS